MNIVYMVVHAKWLKFTEIGQNILKKKNKEYNNSISPKISDEMI